MVLMVPALDEDDLDAALRHGVTVHVIGNQGEPARVSRLGPAIAAMLLRAQEAPGPEKHRLTRREHQIMSLVVEGHTTAEIAGRLRLRVKTVRNNLTSIYAKLQVRGMTEAAIAWLSAPHDRGAMPYGRAV